MVILRQIQAAMLSVVIATSAVAAEAPQSAPPASEPTQDLQQLVAPIALYPDALVGQILAGATYPTQVVDAARWIRDNPDLKGEQLSAEVDKQPWDPSIKALTQFPSVLDNMNQNLSWTSALGDAYFNDPQNVMKAIQALRADAQKAGTLKSTPEQTVTTQGQAIVIQPANPEVVYVPQYSPATVYGTSIAPYPGYSGWDVAGASLLSFGVGTAIGAAAGGWGWGHWGTDWHGGNVNFNRNAYVSHSNAFVNRNAGRYGGAYRGGAYGGNYAGRNMAANRTGNLSRSYAGSQTGQAFANREKQSAAASRGFGQAGQVSRGTSGGALGSGYRQGGAARMDSARGRSSLGGGGRSFSGGGRSFGGGGRGGGGRR